jgi:hypothetical protein
VNAIDHALTLCITTTTPAIIWGLPGIGKTATIEAIGRQLHRPVHTIIGSLYEAADLVGLPVRDGDRVRTMPRDWVLECLANPSTILFLDELTTVDPSVQAAMLRIVNERVVGDIKLPDSISIICAANPPDSSAAGVDLSPPMANRLIHLYHEPSATVFARGLRKGWKEDVVHAVPSCFEREHRYWSGVLATFIERKPSLLHVIPLAASDQGGPWPSPRTWEMAVNVLAAADAAKASKSTQFMLLKGAVGEGAAFEFLNFEKHANLADPEALLANPSSFVPSRVHDHVLQVVRAIEAALTQNVSTSRLEAGWALAKVLFDDDLQDLSMLLGQALVKLGAGTSMPPSWVKVFAPTLDELAVD